MKRYAAKLLFQYRVIINGQSSKRRTCEESIIVLEAASARGALKQAKARGRKRQYSFLNSDQNRVHFEFLGILDLLQLGIECEEDEVWYDIVTRVEPEKRLIPAEAELNAIRNEGG